MNAIPPVSDSCARVVNKNDGTKKGNGESPPSADVDPNLPLWGPIVAPRRIVWHGDSIPPELDLAPFREDMQSSFLVVNFISQVEFGRKSVMDRWGDMSEAVYPSKRALELAFFGRFHQRQDICEAGSRWYGKALCKLSKDLSDPKEMWSTAVLRSAILLIMYELVAATLSGAWMHHSGGITRLLQARGPRRHQAEEERLILEAVRPIVIAKAVTDGERTFLERRDWLTVPWAPVKGQKPHFERLLDIATTIPGLITDRRKLSSRKDALAKATPTLINQDSGIELTDGLSTEHSDEIKQYHHMASTIAARCAQQIAAIRAWKASWDQSCGPITLFDSYPVRDSYSHYPHHIFGPPLAFSDIRQANHYAMYHSMVIGFLTIAYEVSSLSSFFHSPASATTSPTDDSNLFMKTDAFATAPLTFNGGGATADEKEELLRERHISAVETCRTVPYHLSSKKTGCGGAYVIKFPLMMCRGVFAEGGEEVGFVDGVLVCLAETWGFTG
ncbi:MAG: hypothetical protein Q9183_002641 [Haloplaca sp. 2 TL-2023]